MTSEQPPSPLERLERYSYARQSRITTIWIIVLWIVIASLVVVIHDLVQRSDIRWQHFEDGSGMITYCIPFALCDDLESGEVRWYGSPTTANAGIVIVDLGGIELIGLPGIFLCPCDDR